MGAALAAAAGVIVLAVSIPLAAHAMRTHHGPGPVPLTVPSGQALPSHARSSTTPSIAAPTTTALASASASATIAAPGARLFIEDFAGTGATFFLTGVQIQTADGASLASYQLPAHPPVGAFTVSADGTQIAYLAADGVHVANAIDGTQDHVVHALPLDRSRPDPASNSAQLPFANWGRGSVIRWSAKDSFAIAWQGCLWTMASDGSALAEIARNTTSSPVEGAGGVVDATWSPSSDQLLVSVYGSTNLLKSASEQTFASDPSTGSGIATAIVAANGTNDKPLAGQTGAWYWSPDGSRVVGWNAAGTSLITVAANGGAPHTIAALPDTSAVAVSPDGARVAAVLPDGTVNVWPINGGPVTTVHTAVANDSNLQQLAWLDTQQLMLSVAVPDGTTHRTIVQLTGDTRVLPDLHASTPTGYLIVDVRPAG
jgi:hypothetical protein